MKNTFRKLQEIFDANLTCENFAIEVSIWKMDIERELQQLKQYLETATPIEGRKSAIKLIDEILGVK